MKRLVIFASGSGSNAENIINYFKDSTKISVVSVLSNRKNAGVFERCKQLGVNCFYFPKEDFTTSDKVLSVLKKSADYIILAGFLLKVPESIIATFPNRIINIHPALLPKYGGKGMYGMHVHAAVKENGETETGITIHFVNEHYDEGAIIFQTKTDLNDTDTPEDIAQKIHLLEYEYFPRIIKKTILDNG
ncbi:phosphoribosylglycinamide formyltransferase [Flavobacteriaceae bacterium S356]|uniref:Phosphoribosylglycinamide formyltransferase n=1 Tax=Asprobacillus argus TaxID=3076534 RepID=A0ABU3LCJ5_9FLAO|nr:phosphoribosylglycinamide formyltransferase [Flavobacteriaceae bacterium S356]